MVIKQNQNLLRHLLLSLLVHGVLIAVIANLPAPRMEQKEPIMVDLRELPPERKPFREAKKGLSTPPARQPHPSAGREVQEKPQGAMPSQRPASSPLQARTPSAESAPLPRQQPAAPPPPSQPPGEQLFRPQAPKRVDLARLFPSAENAAKLEDSYRRRFADEVVEGESVFLDKEDILFGSFLSRFENAVYGVWRYPQEAKSLGLQGITPVRITFNRRGEIENVTLLESSGSTILDQEVLRTLHAIGPLGALPRNYDKETFKLVAFFHYRFVRGAVSGVIR